MTGFKNRLELLEVKYRVGEKRRLDFAISDIKVLKAEIRITRNLLNKVGKMLLR